MHEVEVDVIPLDVCGVVIGSPYLYIMDAIFKIRANQYQLVKDRKYYDVHAHKKKSNLSLISAHQVRTLINKKKVCIADFLEKRSNKEKVRSRLVLHP